VQQLGPNAFGQTLEPGRIRDCYLGLLLPPPPAGEPEAGTVLIVAPAALLHPRIPQPAGSLIYELLTGHPDRQPGELLFLADLTVELRPWPAAQTHGPASPRGRAASHQLSWRLVSLTCIPCKRAAAPGIRAAVPLSSATSGPDERF
jgi:hypothetical protein